MNHAPIRWPMPALLAATTALAIVALVEHVRLVDLILDSFTGAFVSLGALMAAGRLALGSPDAQSRRLWQFILALFVLVALGEFAESFGDRIERQLRIDNLDDLLLLAVAPIALWFTARFEPVPIWARRSLTVGFLFQIGATVLDLLDDGRTVSFGLSPARLASGADFAQLLSMQAYLLAVFLTVVELKWRQREQSRGAMLVGDISRHLFYSRQLFHKYRYPRVAVLRHPGGRVLLSIGRLCKWYFEVGPRLRERFNKSLWRQLAEICSVWFAHGLDAQAYYMFELYRPSEFRRAGGYLTRYETKNGLFKILTWQIGKSKQRSQLGDKLVSHEMFARSGIPQPPILLVASGRRMEARCQVPSDLLCDLFIKPRHSKGARGTEVVRYLGDAKFQVGEADELSLNELLQHISERSGEQDLLVQPRLLNHPALADLTGESLAVVRIVTCLDERNQPIVTHGMVRALGKLEQDWHSVVEWGAPIDLVTGELGRMTGDKSEAALSWLETHPATGARVQGRMVPCWRAAQEIVLRAHRACADRLIVGWDVAVTPEGPMLLEGNAYADVDFLQRVHRCPIGDSLLGAALHFRLVDLGRRIRTGTLRDADDFD